jgi:hypothetical protein
MDVSPKQGVLHLQIGCPWFMLATWENKPGYECRENQGDEEATLDLA